MTRFLIAMIVSAIAVAAQQPKSSNSVTKEAERYLERQAENVKLQLRIARPPELQQPCSIPLLEVPPRRTAPMPKAEPRDDGRIRRLDPPAPPCERPAEARAPGAAKKAP